MDKNQHTFWSDEDLLTPKLAATFLGGTFKPLSCSTLFYWRAKGIGPKFFRVGNSIRYQVSSLKEFQKSGAASSKKS